MVEGQTTHNPSTTSFDEKPPVDIDPTEYVTDDLKHLDVALSLAVGHADDPGMSVAEWSRLKKKLDWHLLPLLFAIYTMQFIDKNSISSASILGIIEDNKLTTDQFNNLGSAFYIGYLALEWPQNWALQKFPVGKWITLNIFAWSVFLGLHCVCHDFGGLFVLRFLLGASEGCMTTGLMLVTSMFYTRTEIAERIGWTFQCNGLAGIIGGFIAFGVYHATPDAHPNQWEWLMIITAILTFLISILFALMFPDNPTTARFLTEEERLQLVKRVQANQNGIETKIWKRKQAIEALIDPKTWLFAFYAAVVEMTGGIGVQFSLIVKQFGFTTLQTTLMNIPFGATQILSVTVACYALRRFPNSRCLISICCLTPSVAFGVLEATLPLRFKVAHLVGICLMIGGGTASFVIMTSLVTSSVAGHTKRVTTNAIFLVGYSLGQLLSPQFWKQQYRPRNIVPWIIQTASCAAAAVLLLVIRYILSKENKRRDGLRAQAEASGEPLGKFGDFAMVDIVDKNGHQIKTKIEKSLLDLTDKENLAFRYVL